MNLRAFFTNPKTSISPYHRTRNHRTQMLSKCSNPGCSASFRYLHTGKLFRFDTPNRQAAGDGDYSKPPKRIEFFWLCEACETKFTLVPDAATGTRVVALHRRALGATAAL